MKDLDRDIEDQSTKRVTRRGFLKYATVITALIAASSLDSGVHAQSDQEQAPDPFLFRRVELTLLSSVGTVGLGASIGSIWNRKAAIGGGAIGLATSYLLSGLIVK